MQVQNPNQPKNASQEFLVLTEEKTGTFQTEEGENLDVKELAAEQRAACAAQCSDVTKWVFVAVAIVGATTVAFGLLAFFGPLAAANVISAETGFFVANAGFAAVAISGTVILINHLVSSKGEKENDEEVEEKSSAWFSCCNRNVQENEQVESSMGNRVPFNKKNSNEQLQN